MTVFFIVVGLEINREMVDGELRSLRLATLPILAKGELLAAATIGTLASSTTSAVVGYSVLTSPQGLSAVFCGQSHSSAPSASFCCCSSRYSRSVSSRRHSSVPSVVTADAPAATPNRTASVSVLP